MSVQSPGPSREARTVLPVESQARKEKLDDVHHEDGFARGASSRQALPAVQGPGHRTGVRLRHVDQGNRIHREGITTQIAECLAVFKKNADPVSEADGVPQT